MVVWVETHITQGACAYPITSSTTMGGGYQAEVATTVNATKAAGVDNSAQVEQLRDLSGVLSKFQGALASLEEASHHHPDGDAFAHAKSVRENIIPKMAELRILGDKHETLVADDLWPLPTYREMLFIK